MDPQLIDVTVYGSATMGALTVVILIVNWMRKLLLWNGQRVVWLCSGVSAFVALTVVSATQWPFLSTILGMIVITALLAASADAVVSQGKTAKIETADALPTEAERAAINRREPT